MKVASATQDLVTVDARFGWTPHLLVHEVDRSGARLAARRDFEGGGPRLVPETGGEP